MATWVTHLRVSEILAERFPALDKTAFYVGSIAPDSGRMVDDFTYLPTKDVSHWKREGVTYEQRFEDNAEMYYSYCENERDAVRFSFLLGYYVHILTDTIYVRDIIHPFIRANGRAFWREHITEIRSGWYQIDHRFIVRNRDFKPLALLSRVSEFKNDYFDYFAPDDITERIRFAVELYTNGRADYSVKLLTHDESDAEKMIAYMADDIEKILREKHCIK